MKMVLSLLFFFVLKSCRCSWLFVSVVAKFSTLAGFSFFLLALNCYLMMPFCWVVCCYNVLATFSGLILFLFLKRNSSPTKIDDAVAPMYVCGQHRGCTNAQNSAI